MSQVLSNINEYVMKPLAESIKTGWAAFRDRKKVTSVGFFSSTINIYANGQFISVPKRGLEVCCLEGDVVEVKSAESSPILVRLNDAEAARKLVRMIYKQSRPLYARVIKWLVFIVAFSFLYQALTAPLPEKAGQSQIGSISAPAQQGYDGLEFGLPPAPFSE